MRGSLAPLGYIKVYIQPEKLKALDLLFKVRSIRLVGIVLSMFCLVDKVPFLR